MDFFRAGVLGAVVGVFAMFLFGIIAYHLSEFAVVEFLIVGVGVVVGYVTGWAAGHERDPLVGALAAATTGVAVIGGTLVAASLDGQDADTEWRSERSLFTYADNMAFWAMMEGRELEWPQGWSYATATSLTELPPEISERAEELWSSKSTEELAIHAEFAGVHDVRVLAARAEEIERVWRDRGYELDPAPGDPDNPHTPPWELVPEEVWNAAMDEWASLDEERQAERRRRQLAIVEQMRGEEVGRARSGTMFRLLDGVLVVFAMTLAFGFAVGNFDED
ncbi:MAG: hypothetical protein JJU33_02980 [Phycisphaerales bacterium]|nr:hypothetical protein [Phycisphaerales bacterium]